MIGPFEENSIVVGDCLDVMRQMPDGRVDLVVTDPPYGIGLKYDMYDDTEENWYKLMKNVLPEIIRISKMAILPIGNRYALKWIYDNFPPLWLIIWYKGSTGHRSPIGFNDYEPLLVYKKRKRVIMHDYFQTKCSPKQGTYNHPCPKPIEWATWLIARASNQGDLVFDPFIGSGTTDVAADRLGRRFFGCDISETYVGMAIKRLEKDRQQRSQLKMPL